LALSARPSLLRVSNAVTVASILFFVQENAFVCDHSSSRLADLVFAYRLGHIRYRDY
jgi:hypothetical protein